MGRAAVTADHTPGPWHVNELNVAQKVDPYYIFIEPGVAVIERKIEGHNQSDMANALLIAAAPAMLEALEKWTHDGRLQTFEDRERFRDEAIAIIRAAKGQA